MQKDEKYQVVTTKVSPEARTRLELLCKRKGLTPYELLQMVIDTLIRYMDGCHNLSLEMEKAMSIFDHLEGWPTMNWADPNLNKEIHEATYYYTEPKSRGTRAIHVETPFMGEKIATMNIQEILEKTICLLMPDRYRALRQMCASMGYTNLLECLDEIIADKQREEDIKEIRDTFSQNNYHEWGKAPVSSPYVKHQRRGAENLSDRKRILGEESDLFEGSESEEETTTNEDDEDAQQRVCSIDELARMEEAASDEADE